MTRPAPRQRSLVQRLRNAALQTLTQRHASIKDLASQSVALIQEARLTASLSQNINHSATFDRLQACPRIVLDHPCAGLYFKPDGIANSTTPLLTEKTQHCSSSQLTHNKTASFPPSQMTAPLALHLVIISNDRS